MNPLDISDLNWVKTNDSLDVMIAHISTCSILTELNTQIPRHCLSEDPFLGRMCRHMLISSKMFTSA